MKRKKGKKSNAQLIINALMEGGTLRSREISDIISEAAGRPIKVQDVASMLSRLSDGSKCDLGNFIIREPEGNGYVYHMAEDSLNFSEKEAYDLTLKTGKDRYTLEQAIEDYPGLKEYVNPSRLDPPVEEASAPEEAPELEVAVAVPAEVVSEAPAPQATTGMMEKTEGSGTLNIKVNVTFSFE